MSMSSRRVGPPRLLKKHLLYVVLGASCLATACAPEEEFEGDEEVESSEQPLVAGEIKKVVLSAAENSKIIAWVRERTPEAADVVDVLEFEDGVYDCVKRERQPSLRRRLASGAVVFDKLALDAPSEATRGTPAANANANESEAEPELASCPPGSVPIPRVNFDTVAAFGGLERYLAPPVKPDFAKKEPTVLPAAAGAGHNYARYALYGQNWGGSATLNLWHPAVATASQASIAQIWVGRRDGGDIETVEAGWMDHPAKYSDKKPHLFIFSTNNNYANGSNCYAPDCSDWVQLSSSIRPNMGWTEYSVYDGVQKIINLEIVRTDNWYVRYGGTNVGYYKTTRFSDAGMRSMADFVHFGGENAYGNTTTDMGSGRHASQGWARAAYMKLLRWSPGYGWPAFDVTASSLEPKATQSAYWSLGAANTSSDPNWRVNFYYGGPGYP